MDDTVLRIDSSIGRVPIHDIAATRRIESAAIAAAGPLTLMQAAGAALARLALALAPHARTTCVVCGPGNNGGDGIEAATRLQQAGRNVVVVLVADPASLPPDAAEARKRAVAASVPFRDLDTVAEKPDLVIDALLGIGARRAPTGPIAAAIERIADWRNAGARVLAADIPSGLDADRGQPFAKNRVAADDTLSMLTLKPGLVTASGSDHVGRLWLAPLALHPIEAVDPTAWLVGGADETCVRPPRRPSQHKGSFGDVAVVGGAPTMRGAAWLAGAAAHAAGAGRVWLDLLGDGVDAAMTNVARPELMLRPGWSNSDVAALTAAVVICGCGGGALVAAVLPRLLSYARRLVLDADALNAVAVDSALQTQLAARAGRGLATVMTPHPSEAARMLGSDTVTVQADRLASARAIADRYRSVCVLKGAGSIVVAPGALPRVNHTGNASLATAGTGDVLAGWIGGRWAARGIDAASSLDVEDVAFDIATAGVIEHGLAAEPDRGTALRAADLVESLYRRSRR